MSIHLVTFQPDQQGKRKYLDALRKSGAFKNERVVDEAGFADGDGEDHVAAGAEFFHGFEGKGIEELDVSRAFSGG